MASDAEVDLVVNATRALATVQRDLDELVRTAENSTDPVRVQAALNQILSLNRVRDDLNQVIRTAQAQADTIRVRADVDTDDADRNARRFATTLGSLTRTAGTALGPVAGLAKGLTVAGAAAGSAAPLLAGVVVAVESIVPAAALATSGLLTLQLASATVKIAMVGVGDAIKGAFDPDTKPEDLAKAMEKLGPHAKSFVTELAGMRKGFKAVQIDVQNRLFANFDTNLTRLSEAVLPSLHGALDRTADSLNDMARGAARAGTELGDSGILGSALASSTGALSKLERVPGQVVTAFGQLAAASGPALEGLAARAGGVADRIAEKLSKAFASGGLEKAINQAVANIDQLGRIAGNVFGGIGNIINAVSVDGEGLFGTLEKVTQAFEDLTASKEFQSALQALSKTMATLVSAVLPLLAEAFKVLLPLIEILAPPIQELIKHLGEELQPIIQKLGPVLASLAEAFVKLIPALTPIIDLALQLIGDILPILTPLFEHLGGVIEVLTPVIEQLADNIASQLQPILAELPGILEQILPLFLELGEKLVPLLTQVLTEIGPELADMSAAFAELLVELTPLLVKFLEFQIFLVEKMLPALTSIADFLGTVFGSAFAAVSDIIRTAVIPTIQVIVALLNGDFDTAMRVAADTVDNLRDRASAAFTRLKDNALRLAGQLAVGLVNRAGQMGRDFVGKIQELVSDAVSRIGQLPGLVLGAIGDLGSLLFSAGASLIQGLINGVTSKIGELAGKLRNVTSLIPDWKGPLDVDKVLLTPAGEEIMKGLIRGLESQIPALRSQLTGITALIPQTVAAQPVTGLPLSGGAIAPQINVYVGNRRLNSHIDFRIDSTRRRETLELAHGRRR